MFIFALIVTILVVLVKYWFNFWARQGFSSPRYTFPFGVLGSVIVQKQSFGEALRDAYFKYTGPYLGIFFLLRPVLLLRDPALIKRVLISDFDHFVDRGFPYDEKNDPIGSNLSGMPGEKWKTLRAKLSPAFSSGKLRGMFRRMDEKVKLLEDHLDAVGHEVRLKVPMERLMVSVLVDVFWGVDFDAFEEPDHEFVKMAPLFFNPETLIDKIRLPSIFLWPNVMQWLRISYLPRKTAQYALNVIRKVVEMRTSDPSTIRNDFIQTAIELMKDDQPDGSEPMTLESVTAQAFVFFGAGMETTANTICFCIYELSKSPEWMQKVQLEVDELMKKRSGNIEYDDLVGLTNLNLCITETLRFYPGLSILNRVCTKTYEIAGTDNVIKKGTHIIIPVLGLHMDEQFFPNPRKFDPSRYEDKSTEEMPYYPIGAGGRYCIGARMAIMNVRLVLCRLLYRYKFEAVNEKIVFRPSAITVADKNGIHMRIQRRSL